MAPPTAPGPVTEEDNAHLPRLRSGQAVVEFAGWDHSRTVVTMVKEDEVHIRQDATANMANPLVREVLYIYTKINSRGTYRANAKAQTERRYGKDSIAVALDALLEDGLITINKAKSVTATAKGRQAANSLTHKDDPGRCAYTSGCGKIVRTDY